MILLLLAMTSGLVTAGKHWHNQEQHLHDNFVEERAPKSHVSRLDVVCSKDHMTVHMSFEEPFYGVVFSHSNSHHERCTHVGPREGAKDASFQIRYDSCGTVEDLSGQFHENTIIIQYGEDILEAWDEAKRLRCEWLESFNKESSKQNLAISDIEVVELNFQGDDIDCWMEVQEGKGPWARPVGGIVPIGSPLTLVIAINDNSREFDMRVKQCTASDGSGSEIQLTDPSGCVLRPSLLTPFAKIRDFGGKATLVAYSHLFAFKFPDNLDVFVHCLVEVCRHGCPESCVGRLLTDYHPHLRENLHTLESKKHQKLIELTKSKPSVPHPQPQPQFPQPPHPAKTVPAHKPETSHQRGRPQYLTQIPAHILQQSKSGVEISLDTLLSAEQKAHRTFSKNNSAALHDKDTPHTKHIEIGTNLRGQINDENKNKQTKSEIKNSASNIHEISEEEHSHIHHGHSDVKPVPIGHYHRIIGHDAHWNSEEVKLLDEQNLKHFIPPLKESLQAVPQPGNTAWFADGEKTLINEKVLHPYPGSKIPNNHHIPFQKEPEILPVGHQHPSVWSGEEIKILTNEKVLHPHPGSKIPNNHHIPFKKEPEKLPRGPQPEPAAWSADEVKALTKDEAFPPFPGVNIPNNHQTPFKIKQQKLPVTAPQPEPSAWSADEVTGLTKQDIVRPHISDHHIAHFKEELGRLAVSKEIFDDHKHHIVLVEEPKPEPAPWTFDEVGPMHTPGLIHKHLQQKKVEEPKPEPGPWTFDQVKPLTKEDLKVHSLNYKLKSHSHQPHSLPTYKESVQPDVPKPPSPIPVYIPKYTPAPANMNMTGPMMMKMMMSMPTLLPFTYQTARWPQKTTARHLKTDKRNYPYPIPQFTHRQQMMMSVIADRRMDGDEDDLQFEMDPRSHVSSDELNSTIKIGEKWPHSDNSETVKLDDEGIATTQMTDDNKEESSDQQMATLSDHTKPAKVTEGQTAMRSHMSESLDFSSNSGAIRPPISGFVRPALDIDELNKPESKDRSAHNPRALNRKRRSSEPVFGVKQKFQAIALSDLAFDLNFTRDSTAVFRGRREEIIYGICMSPASMSAGVGFILILTLCALIASLIFYEHSWRLGNKTAHLSLLSRTFNGNLEPLYRVSRSHPNSSVR
ncbi:uncharacterized protein LOC129972294 isoform X2 [Argiope bruennichi]|nr:uncharacterized protein LOC129972294 isoform X2 [Argiope bruennichi]